MEASPAAASREESHKRRREAEPADGLAEGGTATKRKFNPKTQWREFLDTLSGKPYYLNSLTKETVWELPEGHSLAVDDSLAFEEDPEDELAMTLAERESAEAAARKHAETQARQARAAGLSTGLHDAAGLTSSGQLRHLPLPRRLASLPDRVRIFIKHDQPPTAEELGRPARVQAKVEDLQKTSYVQGQEDYNIWYGKYASDRFGEGGRKERVPAATHCNLFRDSGFTKADLSPHLANNPICIYFAKGCCTLGHECNYFHHVPTFVESEKLDLMHDVFGRERHAQHRDDLEGVGSFNSTGRTLFVGDYRVDRMENQMAEKIEQVILEHFCVYGPIEEIRVLPNRNVAFVTFCYRAAAEFAKVAMANYKLDDPDDVITVKWAQGTRQTGRPRNPDVTN
eukprot:Gregarina_sp_Poly_1__4161@NODE_2277_length_2368_cov_81_178618_g1457_i0_p1_GENE_NODE_2277_length_2368_cov_81_178618_g1457_i0NODE_2277_length_2368_cov_81_178618_g1457_i0_p1_ORF_typecomplete_len398_score61_61Torus/PF16131_5/1_8e04Torus/PF16131_5/6e27WW/PF00397_26/2_6e05RRM_1/PF00076_22/1_2e04RRM_1/PF00076_22/1_9e05Nup35_RRM_2/PF14605_6/9_1e05RRM_5/PF13893_6/0_0023zfCCCH_3/PF15663_5/0_095RRM_occluded/PF16842_5/0_17zfCCCH_4/PF18044_1/0_94_NODE_2277_length_2368_cov_81_178618_g1457_i0791272